MLGIASVRTYAIAIFDQYMVVTADSYQEEHDLNIVKDVDPLLPLGPLSTHVEHAVCEVAQFEYGLGDTGRP